MGVRRMIRDLILSIIGILFCYSLVPTIINTIKTKITKNLAWNTLIITSFGLLVMAFVFLSMGCYLTFVTNFITGICWFILLFLKIKYKDYR
jgi:uncharacterized protein with PQ loop repeat